ncbi:tetraspanin family protein [Dictyostelium discoideum AX4]|uniref:Probable tetraspanin tspA n=1 Tax=Dictyostelium discoideum TaxID=44689 RepID=TSPA_DICDI|nr:tetraspanin family protein [Dictyostelium discoideum AX4]Q55CV5.1 RecName: Full=Probable tetraspanin tspA [Dictyostelium discoideum]EAL71904.1 tetraspanin family protein [Dictyostelium discoideum AX4]|eukprot:XP_646376.1 tetraspanin family protein [Dictyostelium discoideum AX4]
MVDTSNLLPQTPRLLKVPLIILNIILWILGLVLVIVGGICVSFLSNFKDFTKASDAKSALSNLTTSIPAGVLVIGILFVIFTVVGCFVAYKEKLVGLVIYCAVMLILLVILIGVGGKAITLHNDDIINEVGGAWEHVANGTKNSTLTRLENFLKCCKWSNVSIDSSDLCPKDGDKIKYEGHYCGEALSDQFSSKIYAVGAAGLAIGIIELVAILFSLFLIIRICRSPRTRSYDQY